MNTMLLATLLSAQSPCPLTLPDGALVRGQLSADPELSLFTIHNQRDSQVFVKLESLSSDQTIVVFVGSGRTTTIDSIPLGEYAVSYAVDGRLGDDCSTLVQARSTKSFDRPFTFYRREIAHSDGSIEIETGDNWIELGGNTENEAAASSITLDQFNS
ncbi:MAG: hypothetical protein AAF697_08885 [Pseudomonadota bacterium]